MSERGQPKKKIGSGKKEGGAPFENGVNAYDQQITNLVTLEQRGNKKEKKSKKTSNSTRMVRDCKNHLEEGTNVYFYQKSKKGQSTEEFLKQASLLEYDGVGHEK